MPARYYAVRAGEVFGSVALQMPAKRPLMIAGLAKPRIRGIPPGHILEEARLADSEERIVRLLPVQVWFGATLRHLQSVGPGRLQTPYLPA